MKRDGQTRADPKRLWLALALTVALVLQGSIGAAAILRADSGLAWHGWTATICAGHQSAPAGDTQKLPPAAHHQHCALCGALGISLLPPAAPVLVGPAPLPTARPERPGAAPFRAAKRHEPYISRAPPTAA